MASITRFTRRGLLAVGLSLGASAAMALPITIPTSFIDAEATFRFNSETSDLMGILGIGVSALGNSVDDGSHWSFAMPVTQVSLDVALFSLKPLSGAASGSGLLIYNTERGGALSLAIESASFILKRRLAGSPYKGSCSSMLHSSSLMPDQ